MSSEFIHFITDNFSSGRVITVLVHTYIATLIYEIVNPITKIVSLPPEVI